MATEHAIPGLRKMKPSEKKAMAAKALEQPLPPADAPPEEDEALTPHVTEVPELVDCLPELAEESRRLSDQIAPLEARKKEIGSDIKVLLDAVGRKSVRGDDWIATRSADTSTHKLNPTKLLAKGVSWQTLNECTDEEPKAGYVQVKKLKVKGAK